MAGAIFKETLRRKWRNMLYWGLGLGFYTLYPFFILPSDDEKMQEFFDGYAGILDNFDPNLVRALGIENIETFGTAAGFIGYGIFSFMLLVLSVYAVLAGLNVTANDEDNGVIDILLSLPIPRWRIIVEQALAYGLMMIGISWMAFIGLRLGNLITPLDLGVGTSRLLEGTLNFAPSTFFIFAFTVMVATLVRRKSLAAGICGVFVVASYMLDSVGRAAGTETADAIREISVFAHYNGISILDTGLVWNDVIGLLVVSVIFVAVAAYLFDKRDIAV
jgi:ABC-2 type transport system permease protein